MIKVDCFKYNADFNLKYKIIDFVQKVSEKKLVKMLPFKILCSTVISHRLRDRTRENKLMN